MAITPHTDLFIIKCPLEMDNSNQLTFSNSETQANYFKSLPHKLIEDITYQRKDSVIRYPEHIDSIIEYNYCMYKNSNYGNKWFYAYITNMRYINDNMTEISIKTDVFQSWQFDLTYKQSFIEREHVTDDTVGLHTIDEGLERGEYIVNDRGIDTTRNTYKYVIGATLYPDNFEAFGGGMYNGIPSAINYYAYENFADFKEAIKNYQEGHADAIVTCFIAPSYLTYRSGTREVMRSDEPETYNLGISKMQSLDTYVPVNKKLLTFPYCYIYLSNSQGSANILKQEVWKNENINNEMIVKVIAALTPGCSIRAVPMDYNGIVDENWDEGLTLGKYPIINWLTDEYTNWQTQQGINIAGFQLNYAQTQAISSLGSIASGNIGGGIENVINTMKESRQHALVPYSVSGGANSGDVATSFKANAFVFEKITIKREYAKIIDKYFSMYGYKVNDLKTINIHTRSNWNYIKTIGANIEGDLPQADMQEIKQMFDKGITLWHNPLTFLDYSQSNTIL